MQIMVRPDDNDSFIVSCDSGVEWRSRVDLVAAIRPMSDGKPMRGLILDLEGVNYINSAGLGSIFALRKFAMESGAALVVSRATATVTRLLKTINLAQLVPVTDSLEEARLKLATHSNPGSA